MHPCALHTQARLGVALVLTLGCGLAAASDVHVVAVGGGGAHTSIQSAVNAAQDGDIVLVRSGNYPGDVVIDGLGVVLVGEGRPRIAGHVRARNLATDAALLISGFVIAPATGTFPYGAYEGAVDVRVCRGAVRLQDCELVGAGDEGFSPFAGHSGISPVPDGGPGLLTIMSTDVALIDCVATGGMGGFGVVALSGWGGDGVVAQDVVHLSLVRSVLRGGQGGDGDDPGDGGAGARLVGTTELNVAYSALFGGDAGCWAGFMVTPGFTVDGGHGLERGAGSIVWEFAGLYFGGADAAGIPCTPTPAGGQPGQPHTGPGAMTTLSGFPNTLHAPAVVREGQVWALEVVGPAGETATVRCSDATAFGFRPALEQPRFLALPAFAPVGPAQVIPASQRLALPQSQFQLTPGVDARVQWIQGAVGPIGGGAAFSSARFVLMLDAAF